MNTAILEIRPGPGGDEAKIWAADLLRMYLKFATKKGWKVKQIGDSTLKVEGQNVFEILKNESGVHRVQRIPVTEKRGRIHTSTASVVVLPEIPETEIKINPNDLEWQFFRASTQGGQNVQKVSSAVRLQHKTSNITVVCQEERTQEQNRKNALDLIRTKLWERQEAQKLTTIANYRSVIGHALRSEKIRTYNYPQNRVTDHRLNKSWHKLEEIIDGNLEPVIKSFLPLNSPPT